MSMTAERSPDESLECPLLSQSLEPLFWHSVRTSQDSAWHGHVSFAHWIVQAMRPSSVVELGTHNGVSFAAFCNAVAKLQLPTKCFAIDTWTGDAQAGFYSESVFQDVQAFTTRHFSRFSTLLRCRFNEALVRFPDRSVDLLHIDGLHTYEAVSEDFHTWLPKLSSTAVVLFHDVMPREPGFGVWRLWEELASRYPHFSFQHASGLGVLAVGQNVAGRVAQLCSWSRTPAEAVIRRRFMWASDTAFENGKRMFNHDAEQLIQQAVGTGTNIALGCAAFQSSGFSGEAMTPGGAVNGIRTGRAGFHTAGEANPWWMVDLGNRAEFDRVVVFNRLDSACAYRARNLVLLTSADGESWAELYRVGGAFFGGIDGYPLIVECPGTRARFLRLKLDDTTFFHLDQVEIYRL